MSETHQVQWIPTQSLQATPLPRDLGKACISKGCSGTPTAQTSMSTCRSTGQLGIRKVGQVSHSFACTLRSASTRPLRVTVEFERKATDFSVPRGRRKSESQNPRTDWTRPDYHAVAKADPTRAYDYQTNQGSGGRNRRQRCHNVSHPKQVSTDPTTGPNHKLSRSTP